MELRDRWVNDELFSARSGRNFLGISDGNPFNIFPSEKHAKSEKKIACGAHNLMNTVQKIAVTIFRPVGAVYPKTYTQIKIQTELTNPTSYVQTA